MATAAATNEDAVTAKLVKSLDSLPTLPIVAIQIGEVVHGKNVTVQQVADILKTDPSTSAKLLRLVNSPYFGIPGGVSDVARAIPFVGFNTLYQLVLSISVLDTLGAKNSPFDIKSLWIHSLSVAIAARELATEVRFADAGGCFTAGLLHDMGKIALAKLDGERLTQAYTVAEETGISLEAAEAAVGLIPHEKIGSKLAKAWKFPATLSTPIEHHHHIHRPEVRERMGPNLRSITEIVAAADHVSHACAAAFGADRDPEVADMAEAQALFERNGLSAQQLSGLQDRIKTSLEKSKVFLSLLD
jgi:putative nucleotidyltransferase with HDIG domain